MSLVKFTVDVQRDTVTATAGGGETAASSTVYTGLSVTVNYKDKSSRYRLESPPGQLHGPGPLTKSERIAFIDPWDGTAVIRVNDRLVPNPAKAELPTAFKVTGVRPYEDELQLDIEDVSTPTAVT